MQKQRVVWTSGTITQVQYEDFACLLPHRLLENLFSFPFFHFLLKSQTLFHSYLLHIRLFKNQTIGEFLSCLMRTCRSGLRSGSPVLLAKAVKVGITLLAGVQQVHGDTPSEAWFPRCGGGVGGCSSAPWCVGRQRVEQPAPGTPEAPPPPERPVNTAVRAGRPAPWRPRAGLLPGLLQLLEARVHRPHCQRHCVCLSRPALPVSSLTLQREGSWDWAGSPWVTQGLLCQNWQLSCLRSRSRVPGCGVSSGGRSADPGEARAVSPKDCGPAVLSPGHGEMYHRLPDSDLRSVLCSTAIGLLYSLPG